MRYVALCLLAVLVAGCGGDPQPTFSTGTPTISAPSTTAPVVETPQQFLRRWYAVSDRMELTGKTKAFDALHLKSCHGCDVFSANVRAIYTAGRTIRGAETEVLRLTRIGPLRWAVEVKNAPTKITDASGRAVGSYPGGRTTLRVALAQCGATLCVRSEIRIG